MVEQLGTVTYTIRSLVFPDQAPLKVHANRLDFYADRSALAVSPELLEVIRRQGPGYEIESLSSLMEEKGWALLREDPLEGL